MPGHPDGQNYAIWRGPNLAAGTTFNLSASAPFHAQGQVTNYASLSIHADASPVGGIDVLVRWYIDATLTNQLDELEWSIPNGMQLIVVLPCLGNFVTVDITTPTVASTVTRISVLPTNTVVETAKYQGNANRVQALSTSILAGATVIVPLLFVAAGEGHIFAKDINASTKLTIQVVELNQNGTRNNVMFESDAPFTVVQADFAVTEVPIGLEIINTDGAAPHNIGYHLAINNRF